MKENLSIAIFVLSIGVVGCHQRKVDSHDSAPSPGSPVSTQRPASSLESAKRDTTPISEISGTVIVAHATPLVLYLNQDIFLKNNGTLQRQSYYQNGKWMTYPDLDKKSGYLSVHYPVTDKDITVTTGRYPIRAVTTPAVGTLLMEPENAVALTSLEVSIFGVNSDTVTYDQFVNVAGSQFKLSHE